MDSCFRHRPVRNLLRCSVECVWNWFRFLTACQFSCLLAIVESRRSTRQRRKLLAGSTFAPRSSATSAAWISRRLPRSGQICAQVRFFKNLCPFWPRVDVWRTAGCVGGVIFGRILDFRGRKYRMGGGGCVGNGDSFFRMGLEGGGLKRFGG